MKARSIVIVEAQSRIDHVSGNDRHSVSLGRLNRLGFVLAPAVLLFVYD